MNQTLTKEQLACLELSLLAGLRAGQAVKWCRRWESAAGFLRQVKELIDKEELSSVKKEMQKALEQLSENWQRAVLSERAKQVLTACRERDIQWITWEDARYPHLLKQIEDPPLVLYYRGTLDALQQVCVSVVGSRRASAYGQRAAYEIAKESSLAGFTVVSGLAKGVDACAHKGALDAGGKTAAVMPCGLDLCYPRSHLWLYNRICQEGVVLSEYPPGVQAEKWHFIDRNRIVSGLSKATVVAQAGPKSGSIRTAQLAAEQGREVFGVPGDIFDLEYLGVHNLIQDGANVLTCTKGVVRMLQGTAESGSRMASEKKLGHAVSYTEKRQSKELSDEDQLAQELQKREDVNRMKAGEALWLYEKIEGFGCLPEELCARTGRSAAEVQQAITVLEMQGLVKQDAQQQITRV